MKYKLGTNKHTYIAVAFLLALLAPWMEANACSCGRPHLPALYKESARVFLGDVVKIEVLTSNPVHGQEVTYGAMVRPVETFKGASTTDVQVTFKGTYIEPGRTLPAPTVIDEETGRTLTLIDGGCDFGMSQSKYYIFEKQDEPLQYGGWCSTRVVYESIIVLDFMRSLRDAR
jgi:hypothetical protein